MKKFLVGMLSVFLLMGASILAACGSTKVDLTLSRDSVSILYDKESLSQEVVVATVSGGNDVVVSASVNNSYENIISASATAVSSNRWEITITALNEGQGEVVVMTNQGNVSKTISVDVYSEVTSMTQNQNENVVRKNYAVRGRSNALVEENLLSFQPSSLSRRTITWSLPTGIEGAQIEGTNLIIDEGYSQNTITLTATTEKNISATVVLPVIDPIEDQLSLSWSYSLSSQFEPITEDNNLFNIVPNEPTDEHYTGYIKLNYAGDLTITPVISLSSGASSDGKLIVNRYGEDENGYPIYSVYVDREISNVNQNYSIYFQVGYENYDYAIDTSDNLISIRAREVVNDIEIRGENNQLIANKETMTSSQVLYSEYLNSAGEMFNIEVLPTTVENYSNRYSISVTMSGLGGPVVENGTCPVIIQYYDQINQRWQEIGLTWDEEQNAYVSREDANIDYKTIYLKAHSDLLQQNVSNVYITFTSVDNDNISTTAQLELVKSVSAEEFVFENADFQVDSSERPTSLVLEKVFTLTGQTDIDGISVEVNSEHVDIEGPIKLSNTSDSVIFRIILTLRNNSYGVTSLDSYRFVHENGLVSEDFAINIFLPLTEAGIIYDQGSNNIDSVTYSVNNNNIYFADGTTGTNSSSLSNIMIKNGSTVPVLYRYNSSNNNYAVADIDVHYYDLDFELEDDGTLSQEARKAQVDAFKNLLNDPAGIAQIINGAYANENVSKYAYFTSDKNNIISSSVGFTYAVVTFTGAGSGENADENGQTQIIRIILIESYIAPSNLTVTPNRDSEVSLYASDTVSSSDPKLTRKNITINFRNSNVTYIDISNFEFVTTARDSYGNTLMGNASVSGNSVTWENGRYAIENIIINDYSISFDIVSSSLQGASSFSDSLQVHYKLEVLSSSGQITERDVMWTNISINIVNAQRIESLKWEGEDEEGIYFEIGDSEAQYITLSSAPSNAQNNNISYLITNEDGTVDYTNTAIVSVGNYINQNRLSLNLNGDLTQGTTGYIYLLPEDAIYNGQITYYLKSEQINESQTLYSVSFESLGQIYSGSQTWYDFLIQNAYFKSNASVNSEAKDIDFSEILIRIKITVADGRSFEHAYRIYTAEEFANLSPSLYYRLMNSIEIQYTGTAKELTGGIEGRAYDDENGSCATVTFLSGSNSFIATNSGTIRNINFNGNISANGFVANINTGTIENVTVDVNGTYASVLSFNGGYVGGIAGQNRGEIINSSVLGLQITGTNANFIGGIAGQNSGIIEGARVEFYNLQTGSDQDGNMTTSINTFSGATSIGGLVGEASDGSSITKSYVYNYVEDKQALTGGYSFIASVTGAITLDESFAVRISDNLYGGTGSITGEWYNATGSGTSYVVSYYKDKADATTLSDKYISSGQTGFLDYVNNGNAYFKNVYQSEKVSSINGEIQITLDNNGYYKSIAVSSNEGILLYYDISSSLNSLSQSAINDLNALNTISLRDLISGGESSDNLIVTSSNNNVLRVIGSDIKVVDSGDVTLKLYSKQDVSNSKPFYVKVINSISNLIVSWSDKSGHTFTVEDDSISYLQKTTTRNYIVTYENSSVILGNGADRYNLVTSDVTLEALATGEGNLVNIETNSNVVRITADMDSVESNVTINPRIYPQNPDGSESSYQTALNDTFGRNFTITPTDGVIEFSVSEGGLSITPSTNAVMRVRVITTAEGDSETILPQVRDNNGNILGGIATDSTGEYSKYSYVYYLPVDLSTPFMGAYINLVESYEDSSTGYYTYTFEVTFEITQSYKSLISEDQSFIVSFISNSGNDSYYQDSNATFTLNLSKQKFTNIDVNNYLIESSSWVGNNTSGYVTVHTTGEQTSVLAPGGSSVLQVSVNPDYAYYDYMQLSYSGATVNNALQFELLSQYGTSETNQQRQFTPNNEADIVSIGQTITYTPSQAEKEEAEGSLYFRIWVNTTVNADSTLKITASFYQSDGTLLSSVDNYLTISYLTEAEITVNGEDIAYVARGSIANVEIRLPQDQNLDSIALDGNQSGINISSLTDEGTDPISGIKTYSAQIFVSVTATTENTDESFAVTATVSRSLNGNTEIKTTSATIKIVDFMIDEENIEIVGAENNNLNIWLNVPKTFDIEYNFVPETYTGYSSSDEAAVQKVQELLALRRDFSVDQTYADPDSDFYINYQYNDNNTPVEQSLANRLFFVNGNEFIPAIQADGSSSSSAVRFTIDNGGNLSITGLQMTSSIQMVVRTYILSGGYPKVIDTYFTVTVQTYSDPDIPLTIDDANDFENLNPSLYTSSDNVTANDYILTNDIVLTQYTPFDTSLIRSLDGNGYTIHIKSFDISYSSSTINLALFTTVNASTTLKNVRINLYNGGQITIDTANFNSQTSINIAGLAIENNGIITNCEVVAYRSEKLAYGNIEGVAESSTTAHNNNAGINVTFIRGSNTTEEVYVGRESNWTPTIAGFVITNSGSITNSRVGGESIIELGDELYSGNNPSGYTIANTISLGTFYIVGQGNIAGFVYTNNGSISASNVGNLDVENRSGTSTYATSGFVHYNGSNASISGSFVEGVKSDIAQGSEPKAEDYTREGSSIKSRLGVIAGFIYNNEGYIQDSYSNILIANDTDTVRVYLASGFVYENNGTIAECYSASQIRNSMYSQMNFSGVNSEGVLLANGKYTNCYYFNKELYQSEDDNDSTTETQYSTGAIAVKDPADSSYFYGFALASGDSDGIWRIDSDGPTLIEANLVTYSHRYIYYLDEDSNYDGVTGEDEQGKYILLYATLQIDDNSREINTALGSELNPILIADADDFVEVMGQSTSTNIAQYYNSSMIWGTYRLVNDIDLSSLTNATSLPSVNKAFAGRLYGNSFEITGISITSDESRVSFGLFSSLEPRGSLTPLITNLSMQINQVVGSNSVMTGGLAGYIKDAKLINIDITVSQNGTVSSINGYNFAGTLAGLAFGNNVIKNITVTDPSVSTNQYSATSTSNYYTTDNLYSTRNDLKNSLNFSTSTSSSLIINNLSKYSYAGSVIGFVDNYSAETSSFNINQAENYSINNIRVTGTIRVRAEIAGGAFGLTSYQTHVNDVGIEITGSSSNNSSKILSMKYFAGGVIGQAFGGLSRLYVQYNESTQTSIENSLSSLYGASSSSVERGALDIFYDSATNYTQVYIGGLIGYVGSGKLDISYSKINVISPTAEYAGGIIGGMELDGTTGYNASSELMPQDTYTKYFINEVYATGDVRAKTVNTPSQTNVNAGGIIGVIKGTTPRVALMSVNAFNAIASYDYSSQTEISPADNMSFSLQTNLILGSAFEYNDQGVLNAINLTENNYTSYITLVQAQELNLAGGDSSTIASIGIYEGYYMTGNSYSKLNLFGSVAGDSASTSLFNNNLMYAIASPYNYTSAAVGQTETRTAFLGSGAWQNENWTHPTTNLFPSIRYQKTSNVIYLDQYNVAEVFAMMTSNSDITVIVRGLQSEGGTEYDDVDLDEYERTHGSYDLIENFGGRIVGGLYNGTNIGIISSKNFIKSVSAGFSVNNLTVTYRSTSNSSNTDPVIKLTEGGGLFVAGDIADASISGLTLNVLTRVETETTNDSDSFGLVAPTITNTNISNLTINTSSVDNDLSRSINSTSYILTVTQTGNVNVGLNVGLVSGELVQSSSASAMQVEGISINTPAHFINISPKDSEGNSLKVSSANVGAYFGNAYKDTTTNVLALDLRINLQTIQKTESGTSSNTYQEIRVATPADGVTINMGGFIGRASNINYLGAFEGNDITVETALVLLGSSSNLTVNAGLMIGSLESSTISQPIDFTGSVIKGGLYVEDSSTAAISTLNAGGFAGSLTSSNITLANISQINFEVVGRAPNSTKSENKLDINSFEDYSKSTYRNPVNVANANVGGIIGYSDSRFTLSLNERLNINDMLYNSQNGYIGGDSIQLNVTGEANVGSVIGYANVPASGSNSSASRLNINGALTSNANILVTGTTSNVGGFIGKMVGASANGNTTSSASIQGQSNGLLRYNGGVFSSVANINFGGVVGDLAANCNLTVDSTSFGGALKILGVNSENANVDAGGVIGSLGDNQPSQSVSISISDTYNYGDVFVQYNNNTFNSLSSYYFGGIIGRVVSISKKTYNISNNYTLMTSHNARYIETSNTAHALFGDSSLQGNNTDNSIVANIANNYYSYAVTLTEDQNGTDIGYLSSTHTGYTGGSRENDRSDDLVSLATIIRRELNDENEINNQSGHKLNPQSVEDGGQLNDSAATFNGIKYYRLDQDIRNQLYVGESNSDNNSTDLTNIAIIGDSNEQTYSNTTKSFIDTLAGYSFLSGFVLNVDINDENLKTNTEEKIAGIANNMTENTQIYAVQVKGKLNVGGSEPITIGGLVAEMSSGKITNSSTALDITYRAANKIDNNFVSKDSNGVYGIAKLLTSNNHANKNKIIDNTYSTGSVVSYIDINMYAFANGNSQATISNCYSIAKLDWNDYTTADKMTSADSSFNIGVFGNGSAIVNSYFDYNAINDNNLKNNEDKYSKTTSGIISALDTNIYASSNYDFNYGYPTLKYSFMKLSSYATATSFKTGKDKDEQDTSIFASSIISSSDNEKIYDDYVEEVTYQRLRNNTTPKDAGNNICYFMVPNAGVLSQVANITTKIDGNDTAIKNFVLLYDMDLAHTEFRERSNSSWTSLQWPDNSETEDVVESFNGTLDGNGKTISGLNKTLISEISSGGVIKNLRLTDAEITSAPILATTISGATISNVTLSGNITTKSAVTTLGALTNTLTGANVYATTNTAAITAKVTANASVGGIAGIMKGSSTIKFSSNYGPISAVFSSQLYETDENKNNTGLTYSAVGGLVGLLQGGTIDHSYNATSVLNGYATSEKLSILAGYYYTGGLVGLAEDSDDDKAYNADRSITNSYNSGMIKSGNKSNQTTDFTGTAYAGGIVGKAAYSVLNPDNTYSITNTIDSITNCYNEGAVEALGVNAQFAFRWAGTDENGVTEQLEMYQNSQKNVWAYGIGYYKEKENEKNTNVTVIEDENIFENGASAEYDAVFLTRPWSWIVAEATEGYTNIETNRASVTLSGKGVLAEAGISVPDWLTKLASGVLIDVTRTRTLLYNLLLSLNVKIPAVTDNPDIYINSYDSNGMPTSFAVKIEQNVKANYEANWGEMYNAFPGVAFYALYGIPFVGWSASTIVTGIMILYNASAVAAYAGLLTENHRGSDTQISTFDDIVTIRSDDSGTGGENPKHNYNNQHSIGKGDENEQAIDQEDAGNVYYQDIKKDLSDIKASTRSQNGEGRTNYDEIQIAGKNYYLANSNNIDNILQAGVYTGTITITSEDLLYTGDVSDYTANVTVTDDENTKIDNAVQSVEKIPGKNSEGETITKTRITLRVFTDSEEGLTGNFVVNVTCKYEENLEFDAKDIDYVYVDDKSIGIIIKYLDVANLYAEDGVKIYLPNGQVSDYNVYKFCVNENGEGADSDFVYLYYDTEYNMFVYVPNTRLRTRLGSDSGPVNDENDFVSTKTNWTIATTNPIRNVEITGANDTVYSFDLNFTTQTDGANGDLVVSFTTDNMNEDAIIALVNNIKDSIARLIDPNSQYITYKNYTSSTSTSSTEINLYYATNEVVNEEFELRYGDTLVASYDPNAVRQYLIDNVELLTSTFDGRTMYSQQIEGTLKTMVNFAGSSSADLTHNASAGDKTGQGSLIYGSEIQGWNNGGVQSSNVLYNSDVSLTINPTASENFTLSLGSDPIANYQYDEITQTGQWNIVYVGEDYEISIGENSSLIIEYSINNKTQSEIIEDIATISSRLSSTIENSFSIQSAHTDEISSATHTLTVTLNSLSADTVVVNPDNDQVILGYSNNWIKELDGIEITGIDYDILLTGNQLIFTVSNMTENYDFDSVRSFIRSLVAYQNNFSDVTNIDTGITKGEQAARYENGTYDIRFEQYISNFDAGDLTTTILDSENTYGYQVSFNSENLPSDLNSYSIADITIYRGTYNFNYRVTTYTEYTSVIIGYTDVLKGALNISYNPYNSSVPGVNGSVTIELDAEAEGYTTRQIILTANPDATAGTAEIPILATGNISFSFETNSAYRITNKDVTAAGTNIGLVLENDDIRAYIDGSLAIQGEGNSINGIDINSILFKNMSSINDEYYFEISKTQTQTSTSTNEDSSTTETIYYTYYNTYYNLIYHYRVKDESLGVDYLSSISLGSYTINEIYDDSNSLIERSESYKLAEDISERSYFRLNEYTNTEDDTQGDTLYGYSVKVSDTEKEYYLINGERISLQEGYYEYTQNGANEVTSARLCIGEAPDPSQALQVYESSGKYYIYSEGIDSENLSTITNILTETNANKEVEAYQKFDKLLNTFFNQNELQNEPVVKIEDNYIIISDEYSVINGSFEEEGLLTEYNTFVMQNHYVWTATQFSEYSAITQTLKIEGSEYDKISFTGDVPDLFNIIKDDDAAPIQIVMLLADKDIVNQSNSNISIAVSVSDNFDKDDGQITNNNKAGEETDIASSDGKLTLSTNGAPLTAQPIIFTQDVSLKGIDPVTWNANINIIGNGYYLSSYNTLFSNVGSGQENTNLFMKDLMLLNETYNQSYFTTANTSTVQPTIKNVALYGSILNYTSADTPALISATAILDDIENYTTINSRIMSANNRDRGTLTLFTSGIGYSILSDGESEHHSTGVNYGFISAINGGDGDNGDNGSASTKNGVKGDDGGKGGSIQAYSNANNYSMDNQGILKVGDGGNGGAGGSTYFVLGQDGIRYTYNYESSVTEGALSPGGDIGDTSGFTGNNGIGLYGLQGNAGFKGRKPISTIQLQDISQSAEPTAELEFIKLSDGSIGEKLTMQDLPGYGRSDGAQIDNPVLSWIEAAYNRVFIGETISSSAKSSTKNGG